MNKSRKISRWVVAVLFAFAICFLGLNFLKAQKPPQPVTVWGAMVPTFGNLSSINGSQYLYKDGDPYIHILVRKGTQGKTVTSSTLYFIIDANGGSDLGSYPNLGVQFAGVNFINIINNQDGIPCGFPSPYNNFNPPYCLQEFINSIHPRTGYLHVEFFFSIGADLEDKTIFPLNQEVQWTRGQIVYIFVWVPPLCVTPQNPYHNLTLKMQDPPTNGGIYFTRTNENTWLIRIDGCDFSAVEKYCEDITVIGKNGRSTTTEVSHTPLSGLAKLSYEIMLIKNPTS
jgi:hypothetical protein